MSDNKRSPQSIRSASSSIGEDLAVMHLEILDSCPELSPGDAFHMGELVRRVRRLEGRTNDLEKELALELARSIGGKDVMRIVESVQKLMPSWELETKLSYTLSSMPATGAQYSSFEELEKLAGELSLERSPRSEAMQIPALTLQRSSGDWEDVIGLLAAEAKAANFDTRIVRDLNNGQLQLQVLTRGEWMQLGPVGTDSAGLRTGKGE